MKKVTYLMLVLLVVPIFLGGCSLLGGDQGPALTNWEPSASPDGTRLAYESVVGDHLQLFVRDLSTGDVRQLTNNAFENWSPSWSPDGTRLVFASNRDSNNDIYVLNLETNETTRLTVDAKDDINPFWTVEDLIYFNSNRSDVWEIYRVSPDGTGLVKITETPAAG
jgi:TolB protein